MKTTEKCTRMDEKMNMVIVCVMMSDLPNANRSHRHDEENREERDRNDMESGRSSGAGRSDGNRSTQRDGSNQQERSGNRNK